MDRSADPRDVAVGLVVVSVRAGARVGRIALTPIRLAARAPITGTAARQLASAGVAAGEEGTRRVETAATEAAAAPSTGRLVEGVLAGPLTDAVAHAIAEHHVVERIASETLTSPELERMIAELAERVVRTPEFQRTLEEVAASPAVRSALARQTTSLADDVAATVRQAVGRLDDALERGARRLLRRPAEDVATAYAGLFARAAALAIDAALAALVALSGELVVMLVQLLIGGDLKPTWLFATLSASWWSIVGGCYLVLFWATVGQTPGMRLLGVRVAGPDGNPPRLGRALVRLAGLVLAIIPLFAGFYSVPIDRRRRGLPDYLARTVVVYAEDAVSSVGGAEAAELAAGLRPA
jgi:uncharacterized RDD family membrane protein YckC